MEFKSYQNGRFHVHVHNTSQFKTTHLSLKLARPMTRSAVTATALLPYLWMEGTETYPTAEALLRHADELYGSSLKTAVSKRGDRQVVEAYAGVPDESGLGASAAGLFARATELLFEVVTRPAREDGRFPVRHVHRERTLHQHRIESIFDDKIAFAADRCLAEACAGHPSGLPRLGYLEDLPSLTPDVMWETHQTTLSSADVHVYAVGNVGDESQMAESLLRRMEQSFPTAIRTAAEPSVVPLEGTRGKEVKYVREEQHITQGKLDIAYRTGLSVSSPDYPAMMVMNGILGGFTHSKLFKHVREEASLAYYCSSRFDNLTGLVFIQTGIEVGNYEKALTIIREQVKQVMDGVISDDEMSFTQSSIRNQYTQLADYPMSVADVHFNTVLGGTTRSVKELLAQVGAVKKDDVVRVAQNLHLDTVYLLKNKEAVAHA